MNRGPIVFQPPKVVAALRAMPYEAFLKTPYWKAVCAWMKAKYSTCQQPGCNVPSWQCDTHHKTYERRGCEWESDLKVLCHKHHGQQRGKKKASTRTLIKSLGRMVSKPKKAASSTIYVGDFTIFVDSLSCYLDYLIEGGVSLRNRPLYNDIKDCKERTEAAEKLFRQYPENTTIEFVNRA